MCQYVRRISAAILLFSLFLIQSTFAQDSCEKLNTYKEVLSCIATENPAVRSFELQIKAAEANIEQAGKRANPQLNVNNLWNTSNNESQGSTSQDAQLLFTVELGGKRNARGQIARSQKASSLAESNLQREEVLIAAATNLYRLQQLKTELFWINEAIEQFERAISSFRQRPQLTPEQSVSLTLFRYALEEEKQKKAQVLAAQDSLNLEISKALGKPITITDGLLPQSPKAWPTIEANKRQTTHREKLMAAEKELAQAHLSLEQARAWSDVRIGPAYERETREDGTEERIGLGVSFDLPVFSRNQGGQREAELKYQANKINLERASSAVDQEYESVKKQYRLLVDALKSAPSSDDLQKGHRTFEAQFRRGLVSYNLIIEAHRQLHETVETRHQQELKALQALWRIYQIEGRLLESL